MVDAGSSGTVRDDPDLIQGGLARDYLLETTVVVFFEVGWLSLHAAVNSPAYVISSDSDPLDISPCFS